MPAANWWDSDQLATTYASQEMHALRIFRYLLVAATLEDELFAEVPSDTLEDLIRKSQCSDSMAEDARLALRPLVVQPADNRAIPEKKAEFICQNWTHSSNRLLYYCSQLYVPNEGGARQEIL